MRKKEVKQISTPKQRLVEQLACYPHKERRQIWCAARHLKKFKKLTMTKEEMSEEEQIDEIIEELEEQ